MAGKHRPSGKRVGRPRSSVRRSGATSSDVNRELGLVVAELYKRIEAKEGTAYARWAVPDDPSNPFYSDNNVVRSAKKSLGLLAHVPKAPTSTSPIVKVVTVTKTSSPKPYSPKSPKRFTYQMNLRLSSLNYLHASAASRGRGPGRV